MIQRRTAMFFKWNNITEKKRESPLIGGIVEVGSKTFAILRSSRAIHSHIVLIFIPHGKP